MSRRLTCLTGVLCFGLALNAALLTATTRAADTKTDPKDSKDTKPDKPKWKPAGQMTAKIGNVDAGTKSVELYTVQGWKKIDIAISDDLKVRRMNLPLDFDEKGRPKKYTKKEQDELRGSGADRKLPGYQAEFDALKRDQVVEVHISTKMKPANYVAPKDKKERLEAEAEFKKPQVTMIVIAVDVK